LPSESSEPGAIIIPTNAVNTASNITRGFMSARKSGTRVATPERDRTCARIKEVGVIFMLNFFQPKICFFHIEGFVVASAPLSRQNSGVEFDVEARIDFAVTLPSNNGFIF
jgi:hypothetical protein